MTIAIEDIYRQYGPMVHRRCRRILGNEEEAADAMHDVFVQLVRREDTLDLTRPSSLLYTMATNVSLNKIRTRKRKPETRDEGLLASIAAADEIEAMTSNRTLLGSIFKREEPSTRVMAVLHYVDKMTLEEVAQAVGLSVSGVRKRLRGLKARVAELEEVMV